MKGRKQPSGPIRHVSQVDDDQKRVGQGLPPGGSFRVEAEAAELAIMHYRAMGLKHVRSLEEAEQDPRWQQELQQLCSAGHHGDLSAPAQPQVEPVHAWHVDQVMFLLLRSDPHL